MYYLFYDHTIEFNGPTGSFMCMEVDDNQNLINGIICKDSEWWGNFNDVITSTTIDEEMPPPQTIYEFLELDDYVSVLCVADSLPLIKAIPELASVTSFEDLQKLFPESFI